MLLQLVVHFPEPRVGKDRFLQINWRRRQHGAVVGTVGIR